MAELRIYCEGVKRIAGRDNDVLPADKRVRLGRVRDIAQPRMPERLPRRDVLPVTRCSPYASAPLQYARHFCTSFTASDPSGTSYSSSIVAGIFHPFFLTR